MAVDALRRFAGDTLIYVGEGPGGCTATLRFWHELGYDEDWNPLNGWLHACDVSLPQWPGMHDYLGLYLRGSPAVVQRRVERLSLTERV